MSERVLVVTGGMITGQEKSMVRIAQKLFAQTSHAKDAWLDFKVKLIMGEPVLALQLERLGFWRWDKKTRHHLQRFFTRADNTDTPNLTEVVLTTQLHARGLEYEAITLDALFAEPARVERLLGETSCVLLSSTYLHDLSELEPLVSRLTRPHNRVVLGGALVGVIHSAWEGMTEVDVVAVGYGESLINSLATWIRSGYRDLVAPERGRVVEKQHSKFIFSGIPETKNLDFLPTPNWRLAEQYHDRRFPMIYYESVRGCPYRCAFCNYPYLFDDTRFRFKSAEKMAEDWQHYVNTLGVKYITCLDSLFTMPRRRLRRFCERLIQKKIKVKWICYARADDLADEDTVLLMKAAGAHQVQIGIESGDQGQLDRMNKACSIESNHRALELCRKHGLTSVISLIVGYPGETAQTLENTYQFLKATPPDFYFLATFSVRVAGVPVLQPEQRRRFGLEVHDTLHSMAPYWRHNTMSCDEVGEHLRRLDRRLMCDQVALNASIFYQGLLNFDPAGRDALLMLQERSTRRHPVLRRAADAANRWVDVRLERDVQRHLSGLP